MSALLPRTDFRFTSDQFVISHGKCGAIGVFTATESLRLKRGQSVVIETKRGIEIGAVLRPASLMQARLLGATSSGTLLRPMTPEDEVERDRLRALEQAIFESCRAESCQDIEVLDVEVLFDGQQAIVQFVGPETGSEQLAQALEKQFGLTVRLENLAQPGEAEEDEHGCGKPDCGSSQGGCSSCSTGGCSSCGSSKVDMSAYFSHLRTQMDDSRRTPLV